MLLKNNQIEYLNLLSFIFINLKMNISIFYKNVNIDYLRGLIYLISPFFIVFMVSCKNEIAEINNITRDQLTIEKGKEVEIIYSDSANVRVRITGPEMLYYTDPGNPRQEFTNGLRAYFYDGLKNEQSILTGKYAIRDEKNRRVIIRDSVIWESLVDGKLETSELIWDESTNIIRSTKFVKIRRQNDLIYGFNFETNDKLTQWRILSPKGALKVDELNESFK
jgi:LPS export ABC transporter protein LptC